jgi:transcriptional regulator with XRE-family HTH domain
VSADDARTRLPYELDDALVEVLRERMTGEGWSVNRLAAAIGVQQPTLNRNLNGRGRLSVEEWERIALALGEPGVEPLLEAARRRL